MSDSDDDTYTIPIKDQRVFGAGLKRTRVKFVPASEPATPQPSSSSNNGGGLSASDIYMSIVGGGSSSKRKQEPTPEASATGNSGDQASATLPPPLPAQPSQTGADTSQPSPVAPAPAPELCDICKTPLGEGHESSLAHQVSLTHSHPPSAIERGRKGLAFLRAHGWDPDSRQGLGKGGEGILHPVKLKEKRDTVGLGMQVPKGGVVKPKVEKLNAKGVRKKEQEGSKRREQLQRLFYSSDDVLRYLGEG